MRALADRALALVARRAGPAAGRAEGARARCRTRADALARAPPAADARGGGERPAAARVRRAAPAPARARAPDARARAGGRAGAGRAGRAARALPRGAAVRADRAPGAGDRATSTATSRATCRCSGCSRATSARGRRSSRSTRCCARSSAGYQGALMAPTETLAEQHFLTVEELCRELGVTVGLLTSSVGKRRARRRRRRVDPRRHARADPGGRRPRPNSRSRSSTSSTASASSSAQALAEGRSPHVLHMTATPIPRTLALTVYGDLSVSEIAKPPASRKPIVTSWIEERRASEAYRRLTRLLRRAGRHTSSAR